MKEVKVKGYWYKEAGTIYVARPYYDMFVIYMGAGHDIEGRWFGWSHIKIGDKLPYGGTLTSAMIREAVEKAEGVKEFALRF